MFSLSLDQVEVALRSSPNRPKIPLSVFHVPPVLSGLATSTTLESLSCALHQRPIPIRQKLPVARQPRYRLRGVAQCPPRRDSVWAFQSPAARPGIGSRALGPRNPRSRSMESVGYWNADTSVRSFVFLRATDTHLTPRSPPSFSRARCLIHENPQNIRGPVEELVALRVVAGDVARMSRQ